MFSRNQLAGEFRASGGPDQIHLALEQALTGEGTLMMYASCLRSTRCSKAGSGCGAKWKEFDTSGRGAHPNWPEGFFRLLVDGFLAASGAAPAMVGNATSYLFPASGHRSPPTHAKYAGLWNCHSQKRAGPSPVVGQRDHGRSLYSTSALVTGGNGSLLIALAFRRKPAGKAFRVLK